MCLCANSALSPKTCFFYFYATDLFFIGLAQGGEGYTVPKAIDFPRYSMKCTGENVILRGIFHVFHYISCYIANILITFRTVCRCMRSDPGLTAVGTELYSLIPRNRVALLEKIQTKNMVSFNDYLVRYGLRHIIVH